MQSIMGLYGGIAMECLPVQLGQLDLGEKFEGEDIFILVTAKKL